MSSKKPKSRKRAVGGPIVAKTDHTTFNLLCQLSVALRAKKDYNSALKSLEQALKLQPQEYRILAERGSLYREMGLHQHAIDSYLRALQIQPEYPDGLNNLGNALREMGRNDQALLSYSKAVKLQPNNPLFVRNLGLTLKDLGLYVEAKAYLTLAVSLNPTASDLWFALGVCELNTGFADRSVAIFQKSVDLDPNNITPLFNLAIALKEAGRLDDSVLKLNELLAINPQFFPAKYQKAQMNRQQCDWADYDLDIAALRAEHSNPTCDYAINPYLAITYPEFSGLEVKSISKRYAHHLAGGKLAKPALVEPKTRYSHQKIRVGYLSADFCYHATALLMIGVLEGRDQSRFETYLYSYRRNPTLDAWTTRCMKACEHYIDVSALTDEAIAAQIVHDQIDILVDLKGYTSEARLGIQALRPAPQIVSWLGFPGTLGEPRLADYILGDPIVTPRDYSDCYSEVIVQMPHCYQPNQNWKSLPMPPERSVLGLPTNAFVFCNFNQAYKLTPHTFILWCKILSQVPNSVLWMLTPKSKKAIDQLRMFAQGQGVDPTRLIFAPKVGIGEHEIRLQQADLALDTFPYTSHTTARDALWASVPIVTKTGETFASRVAASLVAAMGLNELIVDNDLDYLNKVVHLAKNPSLLQEIRQKITAAQRSSPLFDASLFAKQYHDLLKTLYQQHHA